MERCKYGEEVIEASRNHYTDTEIRMLSRKKALSCLYRKCHAHIEYCHGPERGPYFRHEKNAPVCPYSSYSSRKGQTSATIYFRKELAERLRSKYSNTEIERESYEDYWTDIVVCNDKQSEAYIEIFHNVSHDKMSEMVSPLVKKGIEPIVIHYGYYTYKNAYFNGQSKVAIEYLNEENKFRATKYYRNSPFACEYDIKDFDPYTVGYFPGFLEAYKTKYEPIEKERKQSDKDFNNLIHKFIEQKQYVKPDIKPFESQFPNEEVVIPARINVIELAEFDFERMVPLAADQHKTDFQRNMIQSIKQLAESKAAFHRCYTKAQNDKSYILSTPRYFKILENIKSIIEKGHK